MKVVIIGGGPTGLYLALLMKQANSAHVITVLERNRPYDTYGWGVVFSDQTLDNFRGADEPTYSEIARTFVHWDDIDIHFKDSILTSGGHGFSGIGRKKLLHILQARASQLGVNLRFRTEVKDLETLHKLGLNDADLVVAADGVNSTIRREFAQQFQPDLQLGRSKYIWLGASYKLDAFKFYFVVNEQGVYQAHCYSFDDTTSTFIVECDEDSWRAAGFDRMDLSQTIATCQKLFERWLGDAKLLSNAEHQRQAPWLNFLCVRNARWFHKNIVLIGDAAHTAHFSVGSGTKLAMEDAIVLSRLLATETEQDIALQKYQEQRKTEALRLQNAARNSMEWFENVKRYVKLKPEQFAYSLLTRSQRISHENLRLRDAGYIARYEQWLTEFVGGSDAETRVPMFLPFRLRELTLPNRVVLSPMDLYSAIEGTPGDFHLVHLGSRALGGAGLIVTEMVCVSPEGRITRGCSGMYSSEHVPAWARIVDFIHSFSQSKVCLQLGHSGRKGSVRVPWEGEDVPLEDGWDLLAPSALKFRPGMATPHEMTEQQMGQVCSQFVRATSMAINAGFDMLELHCAHGYLLSSFVTPISNRRRDEYGGSLENRLRYPLRVFAAMRDLWPQDRPMSVRISATDWIDGGVDGAEAVQIARAFSNSGADIIHVSTGQTSPDAKPLYGRMFQTPFSDKIRNETGIPTIAVGNIVDADQVNSIIAAGRADLCALARPHLSDPHWTLHAAATLDYEGQYWPVQYLTGRDQLLRETKRSRTTK